MNFDDKYEHNSINDVSNLLFGSVETNVCSEQMQPMDENDIETTINVVNCRNDDTSNEIRGKV